MTTSAQGDWIQKPPNTVGRVWTYRDWPIMADLQHSDFEQLEVRWIELDKNYKSERRDG